MRLQLASHNTPASVGGEHCHAYKFVMLYAPMPGEVDVLPFAVEMWRDGGVVCVPKLEQAVCGMTPVRITSFEHDLVPVALEGIHGGQGLREPRAGLSVVDSHTLDAVLVPGLAFDTRGGRLGRGAGYYDRFLSRLNPRTRIIGVCHDWQVVERVPMDEHDVRMHALLTPSRWIDIPG